MEQPGPFSGSEFSFTVSDAAINPVTDRTLTPSDAIANEVTFGNQSVQLRRLVAQTWDTPADKCSLVS